MKGVLFALTAFAAAAVAQSSDCAADYIVETCLGFETAKFEACDTNDWECKCNGQINIITCYNNCPNDERVHSAQGQKEIFCGYASQYPSSTAKVPAQTTTASNAAKTTAADKDEDDEANGTPSEGASGSATSSGTIAQKSDSAAVDLAYNAGGMLAAVAAVAAAVL